MRHNYKTRDIWIGRWRSRILRLDTSESNKQILLKYLNWKVRNNKLAPALVVVSLFMLSNPDVDFKYISKNSSELLFERFSKILSFYAPTSYSTVRQQFSDFIVFVSKRYSEVPIDIRKELRDYFARLRKNQLIEGENSYGKSI